VNNDNEPVLEASCSSASGDADPGVRLFSFLQEFPQRNTVTTICNNDLSEALVVIADLLAEVIGNPCIEGNLRLTDGEPECTVSDVRFRNQDNESETIIPKCDASMSTLPCYRFEVDAAQCDTETNLTLIIERGNNAEVPTGTEVVASCLAD
jgi:hypothetical protein